MELILSSASASVDRSGVPPCIRFANTKDGRKGSGYRIYSLTGALELQYPCRSRPRHPFTQFAPYGSRVSHGSSFAAVGITYSPYSTSGSLQPRHSQSYARGPDG